MGIVQDRDRRPINGATLRVRYMRGAGGKRENNPVLENIVDGSPLESILVVRSDKEGKFRFPAVPAPQRVVLSASADGQADLSTEVPGNREAGFISGTAAALAIDHGAGARVAGRIVPICRA